MASRTANAVALIDAAVEQFKPAWVFALFSGGHDSLTSSYVASLHPRFNGCVHINTGIGIPATRQFVIDTCAEHEWPLLEYKAMEHVDSKGVKAPIDYEAICMKYGFPGAHGHGMMYAKLKERMLRMCRREHPGKVLFISGGRAQESVRRMRNVKGSFQAEGNTGWCAPIWDWSKPECSDALTAANFKRNQTALAFGRSGECLCGAFAQPGELAALEFACPASAARIRALEKRVRAAGFPWGWEDNGPPDWFQEKNQGQTFMFGYDEDETLVEEHLCTSCKWRAL